MCPKGWRIPTGGASGEYHALFTAYSSSVADFVVALKTTSAGFYGGGHQSAYGSIFISSTYYDKNHMYALYTASGGISTQYTYYSSRGSGLSVRCLKK